MQNNTSRQNYIEYIDQILKRHSKTRGYYPDKTTPLEQDIIAYNKIHTHIRNKMLSESGIPLEQTDILLEKLINSYGLRTIVNYYVEPILIYGIPRIWFSLYVAVNLAVFIAASNYPIIIVVAPVMSYAAWLYYKSNRERIRHDKIRKILTEGIKD